MNPRYRDDRLAVYDDFLCATEHASIIQYLDSAKFRRILPDAWGHGYRLVDGDPLVGVEVASRKRSEHDAGAYYPSATALDLMVTKLLEHEREISEIAGPRGQSWSYFTVCPYVYPALSGLGWHSDPHCAGAFIYYAHTEWRSNWGGELLVEYCEEDCLRPHVSSRGILRNTELESALSGGMGYYFTPTPNRIIFLRSRTPHMIKMVEASAGDHLRLSISGFFLMPKALKRMPNSAE
jgi:hypothetical protein